MRLVTYVKFGRDEMGEMTVYSVGVMCGWRGRHGKIDVMGMRGEMIKESSWGERRVGSSAQN